MCFVSVDELLNLIRLFSNEIELIVQSNDFIFNIQFSRKFIDFLAISPTQFFITIYDLTEKYPRVTFRWKISSSAEAESWQSTNENFDSEIQKRINSLPEAQCRGWMVILVTTQFKKQET